MIIFGVVWPAMNFTRCNIYMLFFVICTVFFVASRTSFASPDVNKNDPIKGVPFTVSQGLEILNAQGCMQSYIAGDGVISSREIARLLIESNYCINFISEKKSKLAPRFVRKIWRALREQYAWEYELEWWKGPKGRHEWNLPKFSDSYVFFDNLALSDDARIIPSIWINAKISPWSAYREGYRFKSGNNVLVGGKSSFSLGSWFDVSAEPAYVATIPSNQNIDLHSGYIKFSVGNFEMKTGRFASYWGQGRDERVVFSGNTKPFEMFQLGNTKPSILPWIFKYFGPFKYRLSIGVLGKEQRYKYPFILSGRIMMKPLDNLEFGLTRSMIFGGEGAPDYEWWQPITELFGFRFKDGWVFNIPVYPQAHETPGFANNITSIDMRWRIKQLRNTEFFLEIFCEDPLDTGDFFPQDTIFHFGFWVPRLTNEGDWQLFLEGNYSAEIVYSHHTFSSGFTNRGRIMGMDQGFANVGGHVELIKVYDNIARIWSSFEYQRYNPGGVLYINSSRHEQRFIIKLGSDILLKENIRLKLSGGMQIIQNENFSSNSKVPVMGEAGFIYTF